MTVSPDKVLDGGEIHVCQDGRYDFPALLLFPGTAVSARSWDAP